MQRSFLELNDCKLYYEITGSGPALIFSHGLGGNHLSWWQQVPHFSKNFTCITYSQRGFLPSTGSPSLSLLAEDLAKLIEHLNLSEVNLIGQSMGGWGSLVYSLQEPQKVKSLVMSGSIGPIKSEEIDAIISNQDTAKIQDVVKEGVSIAAGKRMEEENPSLYFLYNEIGGINYALNKDIIRKSLWSDRYLDAKKLSLLTIPVLCISGEEDMVTPPAAVEKLASFLPNAEFTLVPKTGHSVYFERAEIFNNSLDKFLDKVR